MDEHITINMASIIYHLHVGKYHLLETSGEEVLIRAVFFFFFFRDQNMSCNISKIKNKTKPKNRCREIQYNLPPAEMTLYQLFNAL